MRRNPAAIGALMFVAATACPLHAQEAADDPMAAARAEAHAEVRAETAAGDTASETLAAHDSPAPACRPKRRKGLGLGGVLKAVQRSGLTNIVGGNLGEAGAITGAAINTAVGVADEVEEQAQQPQEAGC